MEMAERKQSSDMRSFSVRERKLSLARRNRYATLLRNVASYVSTGNSMRGLRRAASLLRWQKDAYRVLCLRPSLAEPIFEMVPGSRSQAGKEHARPAIVVGPDYFADRFDQVRGSGQDKAQRHILYRRQRL